MRVFNGITGSLSTSFIVVECQHMHADIAESAINSKARTLTSGTGSARKILKSFVLYIIICYIYICTYQGIHVSYNSAHLFNTMKL